MQRGHLLAIIRTAAFYHLYGQTCARILQASHVQLPARGHYWGRHWTW